MFAFIVGKWQGTGTTRLPDGKVAEFAVSWIGRYILDGNAIADVFDVVGAYPSTTTALALKDRARTHRLIAESERLGCFNNRLSILTLPMLNLLHREFSPEELLFVDLVLQNAEALSYKYVDGRFRDAAAKDPMLISREVAKMRYVYDAPEEDLALPTTTACVSGFLVNMLERRVQLISPCPSSDRWPFGCIVFEEGRFETAAELERLLDGMVDRHMTTGAPRNRPARLLPELRYEELPDGFRVTSRTEEVAFESRPLSDFMKALGAELRAGAKTPRALAEWAEETLAVSAADALQAVDEVWKAGALAPVDERDGTDGGPVARISTVRRAPPGAAGRPSTSEACRTTL